MPDLVLLDSAIEDFANILDHITRETHDRTIGRGFVDALVGQCIRLASLPGTLGRARPELRSDLRSFAFRNYVIFFRYEAARFEVVNVIEGHRDIIAYFQDG